MKIKGSTTYTFLGEDTTRGGFTNDKYVNNMVANFRILNSPRSISDLIGIFIHLTKDYLFSITRYS